MPLIQVNQTPGLTVDQKRELVRELTEVYARVTGKSRDSIWVTIQEISRDDWAVGGTTLAERAAKP